MEAKEDPSSSSSKRSRRSAPKRVVSVPVPESKGCGEATPPSDTWSWRKYGQKPIKGSPYPRGYYRCSSSKGCPARKQVERSRSDPSTFIVTYSSDHDHASFVPKTPRSGRNSPPGKRGDDKVAELAEDPAGVMTPDAFRWFAQIMSEPSSSPEACSKAELFRGPDAGLLVFDDCDRIGCAAGDEDEEALFAGLGELPECSVVFRRGFMERQWRGGEDGMRCGIEAEPAAAAWCRSTR